MSNGYSYNDPNDVIFLPFQENLQSTNGLAPDFTGTGCAVVNDEKPAGSVGSLFCPSGQYISFDDLAVDFGVDDFTIDFYIRWQGSSYSSVGTISLTRGSSCGVCVDPSEIIYGNGYIPAQAGGTHYKLDEWCHCALVRKDGVTLYFINGKLMHTIGGSFSLDTRVFSINSRYYGSYIGGAAHYAFVRISKIARWTEDFKPPLPVLGDIAITEKYENEAGDVLKAEAIKMAVEGNDYVSAAPAIDDYLCIGYKVDGGTIQPGNTATIKAVNTAHTVIFIYKLRSDITEPIDMKLHILLKITETVNLTGYLWPLGNNLPTLVWSSEDAAIASVDQNGTVTANAVGKTKIFVRTQDGSWSGFARVKVVDEGEDELLLSILLEVGESCILFPEFEPEEATTAVLWSSSDSSIAIVGPTGKVTGIAPGLVTITAKTADNKLTDSMYVTVKI